MFRPLTIAMSSGRGFWCQYHSIANGIEPGPEGGFAMILGYVLKWRIPRITMDNLICCMVHFSIFFHPVEVKQWEIGALPSAARTTGYPRKIPGVTPRWSRHRWAVWNPGTNPARSQKEISCELRFSRKFFEVSTHFCLLTTEISRREMRLRYY